MKPVLREPSEPATRCLLDDLEGACGEHGIDPQHLEHALYGAAREFLARPGKAFRARLIEGCFRLAGGAGAVPEAALEAIELLHSGSLIVDDIQDDAETRRGAPALHRTIGTPRALNTGNWLYFVALGRLDALELAPAPARELGTSAHRCLVRCHEGQALDLALAVGDVRRGELASVVRCISALKTGALTGFAAQLGAIVAGATPHAVHTLTSFGAQVGVALQMLDDLGSFAAPSRHDKALEDLRGQRASWVWSWASETLDEHTYHQLLRQLERESELTTLRERLAAAVVPLGRSRVHEALGRAEQILAPLCAPASALEPLLAELSRLEHSYG